MSVMSIVGSVRIGCDREAVVGKREVGGGRIDASYRVSGYGAVVRYVSAQ